MMKQVGFLCPQVCCLVKHYTSDDVFGSYILDSRPSSEFRYDTAKDKLVNLELGEDRPPSMILTTPGDELEATYGEGSLGGRQGRLMRLAGRVDLGSKLSVSATC